MQLIEASVQESGRNNQTQRRTEEKDREPVTFYILHADGSIEIVEARSMQSQAASSGKDTQRQENFPQDSLCYKKSCFSRFPFVAIAILHERLLRS